MIDYSDNNITLLDSMFSMALRGDKVATIRLGQRNYLLGKGYIRNKDNWAVARPINITSIVYKRLKDLTNQDAILEGYVDKNILKHILIGIYPDINDNSIITVVNFELLHD